MALISILLWASSSQCCFPATWRNYSPKRLAALYSIYTLNGSGMLNVIQFSPEPVLHCLGTHQRWDPSTWTSSPLRASGGTFGFLGQPLVDWSTWPEGPGACSLVYYTLPLCMYHLQKKINNVDRHLHTAEWLLISLWNLTTVHYDLSVPWYLELQSKTSS